MCVFPTATKTLGDSTCLYNVFLTEKYTSVWFEYNRAYLSLMSLGISTPFKKPHIFSTLLLKEYLSKSKIKHRRKSNAEDRISRTVARQKISRKVLKCIPGYISRMGLYGTI